MKRVLVIDDEAAICWAFQQFLHDAGHAVEIASSAEDGLATAGRIPPDAIVLDVRLPGMDGLSALQRFRERQPATPVIVMTAFGELETAVQAIQRGAFEYLTKPFALDHAAAVVERALASGGTNPVSGPRRFDADSPLIGVSPGMQQVFKDIAFAAASQLPVLIGGETGTGKELVARAIHRHSARGSGPFVPVLLGALSGAVIESELFGHVRGAFTGATEDRAGLIEQASSGTLFLDELGDTPPGVQVKLLRFLETGQFFPVGSSRLREANARVVTATHRHLPELISAGLFREDLYFRLRGLEIVLPPLRDRPSDIRLLAAAFWQQACPERGDYELPGAFETALLHRSWPGNVRELRTAIERAALLARGGPLSPEHLVVATTSSAAAPELATLDSTIAAWVREQLQSTPGEGDLMRTFQGIVEPPLLTAVLAVCHGNRAAAARLLGIDRTTLRTRLRAHGLDAVSDEIS